MKKKILEEKLKKRKKEGGREIHTKIYTHTIVKYVHTTFLPIFSICFVESVKRERKTCFT